MLLKAILRTLHSPFINIDQGPISFSTFCSVPTVCSHHWKSVQHWLLLLLPYITLASQPATGFDVPAAASSPLFITQTWQPSKLAFWYEPLLPLHEPLVIPVHDCLTLSSPPVGMHFIRCSLFAIPDVWTVTEFWTVYQTLCF